MGALPNQVGYKNHGPGQPFAKGIVLQKPTLLVGQEILS